MSPATDEKRPHGLDGIGASHRTRLELNLAASGQPVAEIKEFQLVGNVRKQVAFFGNRNTKLPYSRHVLSVE
jgi:hypothetical protein